MSSEDVKEHIDRALETAVASNADLDDVEAYLENAQGRIEELRILRGEA